MPSPPCRPELRNSAAAPRLRAIAPVTVTVTVTVTATVAAMAMAALCAPAQADCIDDAAARQQVNAQVLRAIGWQESGLRPDAVGRNRDGSVDLGAFQINSIHLPELARAGIDARQLGDGCVSAYVAAWHYRRQIDAHGNTWAAVGAYHSRAPARGAWYANHVAAILMRWNVLPAQALPFAAAALAAQEAPTAPAALAPPRRGPAAPAVPLREAQAAMSAPGTPNAEPERPLTALAFLPAAR